MTEQQQQDLLGEKLATFGLSPLETEVLTILGKIPTSLTLQEIQKHLSPTVRIRKIQLRKCLKKMYKTKWISMTKAFPNTYTIVAKKQLQKNLEAIITTSQLAFQTQKKHYRSILKLLQNLQEPASSIQSKISIPKSSPVFLRRFIEDIAQKFQLTLIKIETNMVIALRRENVFFRLNSAEFEYQKDGRALNCGIVFCMVDDPKILPTNITKIHQYNANGLKFSYKLEAKGYSDRKKRDLSEFAVDPSPQKDELLKSIIKLVTPKKSYKGTIETMPLTKNPHYCASIWKETMDSELDLLTPVKVLQNLKENDTILK